MENITEIEYVVTEDEIFRKSIAVDLGGIHRKFKLRVYNDSNNCKLVYLNGVQSLIYTCKQDKELIKHVLDRILSKYCSRPIVYITVTNEADMKLIKELYKCYFINMIPFGDDTGRQYHIAMVNEPRVNESITLSNAMNQNEVVSIHTFDEKDYFTKYDDDDEEERDIELWGLEE